jgi:hypothetical protein
MSTYQEIPLSEFASQITQRTDVTAATFFSTSQTVATPQDVTVIGEVIVERYCSTAGKADVYLLGVSSNGSTVFNGLYKPWQGHHYAVGADVPYESLLGQIHPPCRTDEPPPPGPPWWS